MVSHLYDLSNDCIKQIKKEKMDMEETNVPVPSGLEENSEKGMLKNTLQGNITYLPS